MEKMKTKIYLASSLKSSFILESAVEYAQDKIDRIEANGGEIQDVQFPVTKKEGYKYLIVAKIKSKEE